MTSQCESAAEGLYCPLFFGAVRMQFRLIDGKNSFLFFSLLAMVQPLPLGCALGAHCHQGILQCWWLYCTSTRKKKRKKRKKQVLSLTFCLAPVSFYSSLYLATQFFWIRQTTHGILCIGSSWQALKALTNDSLIQRKTEGGEGETDKK